MRQPKREQLRVRLTQDVRLALEEYAKGRGQNATISSVLREFIQWLIDPNGFTQPKLVTREAAEALKALAKAWGRSEEQTLDQCILGIRDLVEAKRTTMPLIVREIKLRRSYKSEVPIDEPEK